MSDEIRAALRKLDPKNDAHWTEDGLPALAALGFKKSPSRQEVTNAAPKFTRLVQDISAARPEPEPEPEDVVGPETDLDAEAAHIAALKAVADAAEAEVNEAHAVAEVAKQKLYAAQEKHREAISKLEQTAHHRQGIENMLGIQRVLEAQKRERAMQAALVQELRSAGITTRMLQPGSNLDAAMSRKRGLGQNRPNFNTGRG